MLILQNAYRSVFFLFLLTFVPMCVYGDNFTENGLIHQNNIRGKNCKKNSNLLSYYLYVDDFLASLILIPTSSVSMSSTTSSSKYYAGRAPVYNQNNEKVGVCSASFLCMQSGLDNSIVTDISNYLSINNGLIVSWFTPATPLGLEADTVIHSMVTECIVKASTKIGYNPFYGKTFNMIVSSDDEKIYFNLTKIK